MSAGRSFRPRVIGRPSPKCGWGLLARCGAPAPAAVAQGGSILSGVEQVEQCQLKLASASRLSVTFFGGLGAELFGSPLLREVIVRM
jgi:hypothetical protein